jgi:DNA modification methylase
VNNSHQEKLWKINKLICGDNLDELAKLLKENIDLIYIDPPFFTHKQYEVVWGDEAEIRSYKDRWEGGIEHYIGWLKPRVQAMYETLKPTGSFYIHCDWHANAHIRIMCDEVFGKENFQNEIIWSYQRWTGGTDRFQRMHDTIFFYAKDKEKHTFNIQYEPYSGKSKHPAKRFSVAERGKVVTQEYTEDKSRLKAMRDIWEISYINSQAKERVGYPTQKPEALLERIIKASSSKGDLVLDAFCGCGTTVAVAQQLGRRWIGIDISPTAIKVIQRRLKRRLDTIEGINYEVFGMPTTVDAVRKLKPFEFQNWVVIDKMRAKATRKKIGDMGLDGYFPKSILTEPAGIQVKQSDGIGRNVVDNFETALKRGGYKKGYLIAFSFSKGVYEEVARVKKEGMEIKLITVEELLGNKEVN